MTLGERICRYRTERGMSQIEVAERLDVSRQSVSKWETDSAVPDLDKLVKLSELFGVTLDELVKGEGPAAPEEKAAPASEAPAPEVKIVRAGPPVRVVVGAALLAAGLLGGIFLFVLRPALGLTCLPLVVCGVICLVVRKNAGLICGWILYGLWLVLRGGAMFRGISTPLWVFRYLSLAMEESQRTYYLYALIMAAEIVLFAVLAAVTVYRICRAARERR